MGIFLNAVYSKIDVFVKFESAINLETKVQIKKKLGFLLFGSQGSHICTPGMRFFRNSGIFPTSEVILVEIPDLV